MEEAGATETAEYALELRGFHLSQNLAACSLENFFEARLLRTIGKSLIVQGWRAT